MSHWQAEVDSSAQLMIGTFAALAYVGPNASLVARPPPADLLICAKDLFFGAIAAMIGGRARGVPRLRLRAAQQALRTLRAMCDPIERVPPHGAWLWRLRDDVAARWR